MCKAAPRAGHRLLHGMEDATGNRAKIGKYKPEAAAYPGGRFNPSVLRHHGFLHAESSVSRIHLETGTLARLAASTHEAFSITVNRTVRGVCRTSCCGLRGLPGAAFIETSLTQEDLPYYEYCDLNRHIIVVR